MAPDGVKPGINYRVFDISARGGIVFASIRQILTDHLEEVHALHPSAMTKASAKNGGRFYSGFNYLPALTLQETAL